MTSATAIRSADAPSQSRRSFRADIQGLRAVAILMVAVYHVWVGRVSGGVDVFLMISGFFVGASVVRSYADRRAPRLWRYYARIFGRLVPQAALVLAAVLLSTWFLLPATRMTETAHQALASLFYYENWYLATTGREYAAADPTQSMTQHFWSLSVQGQIFVATPLLLLLLTLVLRRFATLRVLLSVVVALAIASFVYAAYLVQVDQGLAYYSTFARAWQFLLGTVLAFVVVLGPVQRLPQTARAWIGALGMAAVLMTGVVVDGLTAFPGPAALLPLLGAAGVIVAGAAGSPTVVTRALSFPPLVRAGGSAYGFYLWHWPVLVLYVTLADAPAGWLGGTTVLIVAAALTWATEKLLGWRPTLPARAVRGRRRHAPATPPWWGGRVDPQRIVAVASVLAVVVGSGLWLSHVESERRAALASSDLDLLTYPGALTLYDAGSWSTPAGIESVPDPVVALEDWPARDREGCTADIDERRVYSCLFGDPYGKRGIALVGGSHAVSFVEPLDAISRDHGIRLEAFFKRGCPLSLSDRRGASCTVWSEAVIEELVDSGVDAVVVTGTRPAEGAGDHVPETYTRAWDRLTMAGIPVVAIRDNPWLPFHAAECVAELGGEGCSVDRALVLSPENPLDEIAADDELLFPVDLSDYFCTDLECSAVVGNVQVYIDEDHLTATYSRTLTVPLGARLGAATGWW